MDSETVADWVMSLQVRQLGQKTTTGTSSIISSAFASGVPSAAIAKLKRKASATTPASAPMRI